MIVRRPLREVVLSLVLALTLAARCDAGTLPQLEADSLGGMHVVLPRDAAGKPLVLLLAYTKESQSELQKWSRKLLDDHITDRAAVFVVVVADRIASFARKGLRKTVLNATVGTTQQTDSRVLITFDGTGWRELVPPADKTTIGVVVCDGAGVIRYAKRGAFNTANLTDVEQATR